MMELDIGKHPSQDEMFEKPGIDLRSIGFRGG